jgi:hypothetical protein
MPFLKHSFVKNLVMTVKLVSATLTFKPDFKIQLDEVRFRLT